MAGVISGCRWVEHHHDDDIDSGPQDGMPLFKGNDGTTTAGGAGSSSRGGGGGSNTAASASQSQTQTQRDTLDTPKSRFQRILLHTVPLRFPFPLSSRETAAARRRGRGDGRRPAAPLIGETHFGTSGEAGALPIRIRVVFLVLNVVVLAILGLLGFHPHAQEYVAINDKALHFLGFLCASCLCYGLFDIDESARRLWLWRHFPLLFSALSCLVVGSIGSEFVQALLPYKTFQWGDVAANVAGSALGIFLSYHAERRYRARRELERLYQPLDANDEDAFELDLEFGLGEDDDEDSNDGFHRSRAGQHSDVDEDDDDERTALGKAGAAAGKRLPEDRSGSQPEPGRLRTDESAGTSAAAASSAAKPASGSGGSATKA